MRIPAFPEEFTEESYKELISQLNTWFQNVGIDNMGGQVVEGEIPAQGVLQIPHALRIIPRYRIILKQVGGGVITDGTWTSTYVELKNRGDGRARVTVLLVRE